MPGTVVYTVPENMRAVVTAVTYVHTGTLGGGANVKVHGITVWFADTQAPKRVETFTTRQVAYERETIAANTGSTGQSIMVSGFLFTDPSTGPHPPGGMQLREWNVANPLPAELDLEDW